MSKDFNFLFFSFKKGEVKNGLLVDSRDEMAYYPLGSSIVAFPLRGGQKSFLTGHTYLIGTIAISNSGKYLASGETDNVGTKVIKYENHSFHIFFFKSQFAISESMNYLLL